MKQYMQEQPDLILSSSEIDVFGHRPSHPDADG